MPHSTASDLIDARRKLIGERDLFAPSELFHENSKIVSAGNMAISAGALSVSALGFKRFQHADSMVLPPPNKRIPSPIEATIQARRSCRSFGGAYVSLADLAEFAFLTIGSQGKDRRCLPSAGGLYPLELYIAARRIEGLEPGLLHYQPLTHALTRLTNKDPFPAIRDAIFVPEAMDGAAAVFLITSVFGRSKIKYGERAYRFALLEAGHAMQNLLLATTEKGLGSCPIGGFIDDRIHDLIDIDGVEEAALYAGIIGHPA